MLLFVMIFSGRAFAASVTCDDTKGQHLPAGDAATDLAVTGPCKVAAGAYTFHNVNIYTLPSAGSGGTLSFDDAKIDFYAENIVVEGGGSLVAGSSATPIGTAGGQVTIHLWGAATDAGVTCASANCGAPDTIWNTKDLDCPMKGCPAFQVTFPSSSFFEANDSNHRPDPVLFGSSEDPSGFKWNINYKLVGPAISGTQCNYTSQPQDLLCQKMRSQ